MVPGCWKVSLKLSLVSFCYSASGVIQQSYFIFMTQYCSFIWQWSQPSLTDLPSYRLSLIILVFKMFMCKATVEMPPLTLAVWFLLILLSSVSLQLVQILQIPHKVGWVRLDMLPELNLCQCWSSVSVFSRLYVQFVFLWYCRIAFFLWYLQFLDPGQGYH